MRPQVAFAPRGRSLRTLDRYVFREVAASWIAVSGVLLLILLSLQLSRVLSQAAANGFPKEVVFSLIGLTTVGYLPIVVPIGLFLAIMLALGRLYHESEMAAIQSCGVGPGGMYRPISILGVLVALMLIWMSFVSIPRAMARAHDIRNAAMRDAQFGSLEAGRFRSFGGGQVVFYAERADANGILHNVHVFVDRPAQSPTVQSATPPAESGTAPAPRAAPVATQPAENRFEIWIASRAQQRGAGQSEQTFVLYDGRRYEGVPGSGEFQTITFSEGGIPIDLGDLRSRADTRALKPSADLFGSSDPADVAELERRISAPLMTLVLMLMAVPLARVRPRQGRFGRLGIGILVYFLYSVLLDAAATWIENGTLPANVGVWWVHGVALCFGIWMLVRENPPGRARLVPSGA